MAELVAICISKKRNEPKKEVLEASFVKGMGIEGDAHFGIPGRPVSLLREEDIKAAEEEAGFPFPPGSLAENLVIRGLSEVLPIGTRLKIRDVVLRIVERGKKPGEPHTYDYRGWCLLPTVGYFLDVEKGGVLYPKDPVEVDLIVE